LDLQCGVDLAEPYTPVRPVAGQSRSLNGKPRKCQAQKTPRYAGLDVNPAGFGTLRNLGWLPDLDKLGTRKLVFLLPVRLRRVA
ncbi:MAG TPA: hypothetical protein VIR56_00165, partial [Solimonas sp.]